MKIYTVKELGNFEINGKTPLVVVRKAIRKIISNVRKKNSKIDIYTSPQFNKMAFTVIEKDTQKEIHYMVSVVKNVNNKSLYYHLDYQLEVYKKLNNI